MSIPLSDLEIGTKAKITKVEKSDIRKSLLDMGFIPGTLVERLRTAPLADPLEFKLRGFKVSLRKKDAATVLVRRK
jgi:ferrous iron transport protein A